MISTILCMRTLLWIINIWRCSKYLLFSFVASPFGLIAKSSLPNCRSQGFILMMFSQSHMVNTYILVSDVNCFYVQYKISIQFLSSHKVSTYSRIIYWKDFSLIIKRSQLCWRWVNKNIQFCCLTHNSVLLMCSYVCSWASEVMSWLLLLC